MSKRIITPEELLQVKGRDGNLYDVEYRDGKLYIQEIDEPTPPPPTPVMSKMYSDPVDKPEKKPKPEGKPRETGEKLTKPPLKLEDNAFRARLRSVMLDNKYDRRLRGRTRGNLDMKALPKAMTGSLSVFTRKEARKNKHYNITFLVDCSGSMSGDRAREAAKSLSYLLNNFEGLNINTSVILFNEHMWKIKDFKEAYTKELAEEIHDVVYNLRIHGKDENADYHAMSYAYTQFPNDGTNILVMLSDGQPTKGTPLKGGVDLNWGESSKSKLQSIAYEEPLGIESYELKGDERSETQTHMHNLVKRNAERVSSIGIGIQRGGWQIPDNEVINDTDELKATMIKMLRKKVRRG